VGVTQRTETLSAVPAPGFAPSDAAAAVPAIRAP
jgi:hypothetical protein